MSLDPNKTYLVWNGTKFPNSTTAAFKAPAGSTIDWGDGTVETFNAASTTVNTHTYTDGKTEHTIAISGLTSIGNRGFLGCTSLMSVTIGNSVTSIGFRAFENCSSLASVNIPNSVTSISFGSFYNCSSLTSVTIPDSVTIIEEYVCSGCSSLTSVTIGNSVTDIYNGAFKDCSSLVQLIIFPSTPPTLVSDAIPSTIRSIYVQQSSKVTYQIATNWNAFAGKIVSDNMYLSFVRFNQKNKEYINEKFDYLNNNTGASLEFSIDNSTFVLTATLKNANGDVLGTPQEVDLPIESVVVNGTYNNESKTIILTLQNGNTINIPVVDLVDGLSTATNIENGTGDVLVKTTDSNQSFKVMTDGRAKVQAAPVDNDDVVRLSEVNPILSDYVDDALLGG